MFIWTLVFYSYQTSLLPFRYNQICVENAQGFYSNLAHFCYLDPVSDAGFSV